MGVKDETGHRYGRLLVIERVKSERTGVRWLCRCDCGNPTVVLGNNLRCGNTKSCGCLGAENVKRVNTTHSHSVGYTKSRTYRIWAGMLQRAGKRADYMHVKVCDRWLNFENFLADMGEAPSGMTLDRFPDKSGGYGPDNCRWASQKQQQNNRTNNKIVVYMGEGRTLAEWCDVRGMDYYRVSARLRLGWDVARAFETPKLGPTVRNLTSFRDPVDL